MTASEPTLATGELGTRWRVVATAAAIAAFGLFLQATTYLNQDIAWIIYSAAWMLDGAVFGRDIVEPNPPLAWLLAMPAAAGWRFLDLAPDQLYRLSTTALVIAVVLVVHRRMRALALPRADAWDGADILAIVLVYYFFIGCYRDFGQREYLCLALALPYLLLAARRAEGGSARWPVAVAIGAAAGIGFALKPYFLAAPVLVEAALMLRARRIGTAVRADTIALGAVVGAYAAGLLLFVPDYLEAVVPLVQTIYWSFDVSLAHLVLPAIVEMLGLAAALRLFWTRNRSGLQMVLLAAAAGFLLSYFVQGKGYSYHLFPARVLIGTSLVLHLHALLRAPRQVRSRAVALAWAGAVLVFLANAVYVSVWYGQANRAFGSEAAQIRDAIAVADRHAAGDSFLALATHPFPAFPTALYSDARWGSRANGTWLIPAIAKWRADPPVDIDTLQRIERTAWAWLHDELLQRPSLVFVDARERRHALENLDFDILAFYLENAQIRAQWRSYRELAPVHGLRVFVRNEEVSP